MQKKSIPFEIKSAIMYYFCSREVEEPYPDTYDSETKAAKKGGTFSCVSRRAANRKIMAIKDLMKSENALLMLTPQMLSEYSEQLVKDVLAKYQPHEETLYTPREFAKRHHVDVSTLWRWVQNGTLSKITVAGKVYYKDSLLKMKEI